MPKERHAARGGTQMDYKRQIVELVMQSDNNKLLELVYRFCKKILS